MTSMKTLLLGLSAAALTIGGVACAQAPANNAPAAQKPRMERPKMDADGDGVITRAEAQTRATELFAKLDVNKDGKLDKADRELMHQQMREKMFAKLDTNGDGSISKAEFMADRGPEGRGPGGPGPDGMDGPRPRLPPVKTALLPAPPGGEHDGMRAGMHGVCTAARWAAAAPVASAVRAAA
ncbi:EF-hand domain-containing protein [Novosphingobium resinovorum]